MHLGFDLAVTVKVAVLAGNTGKVVFADYLGIYGNTVILDHGMGVQSLYAHLSSISVKVGRYGGEGRGAGRSGNDRPRGRRPPAFRDAGRRIPGEPGRVVGRDTGSRTGSPAR